jgi:hypothetical protein
MFITNKFVCFYCNHFGVEKKIRIPYKQIRTMTKENTAMVLPNAIEIKTSKNAYMFRSFLARDEAYSLINNVWRNYKLAQAQEINELAHEEEENIGDIPAAGASKPSSQTGAAAAAARTAPASLKDPKTPNKPAPLPVVPISRPAKVEVKYHKVVVQPNTLEVTHNPAGKRGSAFLITIVRGHHTHTVECDYSTFRELYDEIQHDNSEIIQVPFPQSFKSDSLGLGKLTVEQADDRLHALNTVMHFNSLYFISISQINRIPSISQWMKTVLENVRYIMPEELRHEIGSFLKISDENLRMLEVEIPENSGGVNADDIQAALVKRAEAEGKRVPTSKEPADLESVSSVPSDTVYEEEARKLVCYVVRAKNPAGKPVFEVCM